MIAACQNARILIGVLKNGPLAAENALAAGVDAHLVACSFPQSIRRALCAVHEKLDVTLHHFAHRHIAAPQLLGNRPSRRDILRATS
jgi:hypothetical protein